MRTYLRVRANRADEVTGEVVREQPLTLWVNGEKFLTLLCSPIKLEALVVGYLWMEKVIEDAADITRLDVSAVDGRADVTLARPVTLPTKRILTSGGGGGITVRLHHWPRLLRDAAQGRANGRAARRVADVAHGDGGRARRAAQRHRLWVRPGGQPQPLRRERAPAGGGGHGDAALTRHGPGACSVCRRRSSDAPRPSR